jgi:hypothetical protein
VEDERSNDDCERASGYGEFDNVRYQLDTSSTAIGSQSEVDKMHVSLCCTLRPPLLCRLLPPVKGNAIVNACGFCNARWWDPAIYLQSWNATLMKFCAKHAVRGRTRRFYSKIYRLTIAWEQPGKWYSLAHHEGLFDWQSWCRGSQRKCRYNPVDPPSARGADSKHQWVISRQYREHCTAW